MLGSFADAQSDSPQIGTLKISKKVTDLDTDGSVEITVEIHNNSTVPIYELEVFEYYPPEFVLPASASIAHESFVGSAGIPPRLETGVTGAQAQFIVTFPPSEVLLPGETATLSYRAQAPSTGNFQIPTSLIWYSYTYSQTLVRSNVYSNGLLVHIPNEFELAANSAIPYAVAIMTFGGTVAVFLKIRKYL